MRAVAVELMAWCEACGGPRHMHEPEEDGVLECIVCGEIMEPSKQRRKLSTSFVIDSAMPPALSIAPRSLFERFRSWLRGWWAWS
jgi:hypothetical protein